jgi:hypothetical protein
MIGNISGRQNTDCFFDLQLAVPKNLSDPELKEWRIVGTPFSHDIKWKGQGHYFVWEDPDQAFRDPLNPNRWLLIHVRSAPFVVSHPTLYLLLQLAVPSFKTALIRLDPTVPKRIGVKSWPWQDTFGDPKTGVQVRIFAPFYSKRDHFTKTGSGQT